MASTKEATAQRGVEVIEGTGRRRTGGGWRAANLIRERPASEEPRERLLCCGGKAVSDPELVATLLGWPGGQTGRARELLELLGGLSNLASASTLDLLGAGLTEAQCARLMAAGELARRLVLAEAPPRQLISRPSEVATYLALLYCGLDQEVMGALFADTKNQLLAQREIFRGTLSRTAVEPRPILRQALALGAAGLILFHTHPSGDPTPSAEDLLFTRRMVEAGDLLGVRLVDHLVVAGTGRWVSLRERRAW
jgi:DNA repair protein RadC